MSENMIFCKGEGESEQKGIGYQKSNMAFNKKVTNERFLELREVLRNDILKDLKLELNENSWSDEWKKVTKKQWARILEIPEADKEVIESIIGFELELKEEEMLRPSVLYQKSLKISVDGDKYCVLMGENLVDGVVGFGDSLLKALHDFDVNIGKEDLNNNK